MVKSFWLLEGFKIGQCSLFNLGILSEKYRHKNTICKYLKNIFYVNLTVVILNIVLHNLF